MEPKNNPHGRRDADGRRSAHAQRADRLPHLLRRAAVAIDQLRRQQRLIDEPHMPVDAADPGDRPRRSPWLALHSLDSSFGVRRVSAALFGFGSLGQWRFRKKKNKAAEKRRIQKLLWRSKSDPYLRAFASQLAGLVFNGDHGV